MRNLEAPPADLPRNWRAVVIPSGNHRGRKMGELPPSAVKTLTTRGYTEWIREIARKACKEMGLL